MGYVGGGKGRGARGAGLDCCHVNCCDGIIRICVIISGCVYVHLGLV